MEEFATYCKRGRRAPRPVTKVESISALAESASVAVEMQGGEHIQPGTFRRVFSIDPCG
jgi:hypothetical protein